MGSVPGHAVHTQHFEQIRVVFSAELVTEASSTRRGGVLLAGAGVVSPRVAHPVSLTFLCLCSWWTNWVIPAISALIVALMYRLYMADD